MAILVKDSKIDVIPPSLIRPYQSISKNDPVCYLVVVIACWFARLAVSSQSVLKTVALNTVNQPSSISLQMLKEPPVCL